MTPSRKGEEKRKEVTQERMQKDHSLAQKRAGEDELASLHGMFAQFLKGRLQNGDVKPAELSVIRQFLKDNGIECIGEMNNDLIDLAEELPKFGSEELPNLGSEDNIRDIMEAVS